MIYLFFCTWHLAFVLSAVTLFHPYEGLRVDPLTTVPQENGSDSHQLRAASFAPCDIQIQDSGFVDLHQSKQQQQHYGDRMAPNSGYCAATGLDNGGSTGYSAPLSPLSALWCHGLPSGADYYGPGMVGLIASLPPSSLSVHYCILY